MGETQEGIGEICGMNVHTHSLVTSQLSNCKNITQAHGNFSKTIFSLEKIIKQIIFHQTE